MGHVIRIEAGEALEQIVPQEVSRTRLGEGRLQRRHRVLVHYGRARWLLRLQSGLRLDSKELGGQQTELEWREER